MVHPTPPSHLLNLKNEFTTLVNESIPLEPRASLLQYLGESMQTVVVRIGRVHLQTAVSQRRRRVIELGRTSATLVDLDFPNDSHDSSSRNVGSSFGGGSVEELSAGGGASEDASSWTTGW